MKKTITIKLFTKYFNHSLTLRIPLDKGEKLYQKEDPLDYLTDDLHRVHCGYPPLWLSKSQVYKMRSFNQESGDYFNRVEFSR